MSSETKRRIQCPPPSLRCRVCETEHALEPVRRLPALLRRRSTPSTTRTSSRAPSPGSRSRAGPLSIWRYAAAAPRRPAGGARLAPGLHAARRGAPRLASALGVGELWLKLDTANPTHSFKDRVVAVACAKAQELGLDTLSCSSTGNLANAVAARAAAEGIEAAVFCPATWSPRSSSRRPSTARRSTPSTAPTTTAAGSRSSSPSSCPGASSTSGCGPTTRKARRRSPTRSPSSSAGERPTSSSRRSRPAPSSRRSARASPSCAELGLVEGCPPRLYRRPGRGMLAGRHGVRRGTTRHAGPAAARPRAPSPSAAPPTATSRSRRHATRAATSTRSPRTRSAPTWRCWRRRPASSARRPPASRSGRCGRRCGAAQVGEDDEVVLLVTGDGLKTPEPVAELLQPVEIDADADALLERLGAAA